MKLKPMRIFWTELCLAMRPLSILQDMYITTIFKFKRMRSVTPSLNMSVTAQNIPLLEIALLATFLGRKYCKWNCLPWHIRTLCSFQNRRWKLDFLARLEPCLTIPTVFFISLMQNFLNVWLEEVDGRLGHRAHPTLQVWAFIYRSMLNNMSTVKGFGTLNTWDNGFKQCHQ